MTLLAACCSLLGAVAIFLCSALLPICSVLPLLLLSNSLCVRPNMYATLFRCVSTTFSSSSSTSTPSALLLIKLPSTFCKNAKNFALENSQLPARTKRRCCSSWCCVCLTGQTLSFACKTCVEIEETPSNWPKGVSALLEHFLCSASVARAIQNVLLFHSLLAAPPSWTTRLTKWTRVELLNWSAGQLVNWSTG